MLTIGKELFGLVGVVGEASAPAAPARGRGKKAEAGEPAVVAVATTGSACAVDGQAAPLTLSGIERCPHCGLDGGFPPAPTKLGWYCDHCIPF